MHFSDSLGLVFDTLGQHSRTFSSFPPVVGVGILIVFGVFSFKPLLAAISSIFCIARGDGIRWPFSHRFTEENVTPSCTASFSWLIPSWFRIDFMSQTTSCLFSMPISVVYVRCYRTCFVLQQGNSTVNGHGHCEQKTGAFLVLGTFDSLGNLQEKLSECSCR